MCLKEHCEKAKKHLKDKHKKLKRYTEDHPHKATGLALGAGLLSGYLLGRLLTRRCCKE